MWHTHHQPLCPLGKPEMQVLLLPCRNRQELPQRRVHRPLAQVTHLPVSIVPTPPQSCNPASARLAQCYPDSSVVAATGMVPDSPPAVVRHLSLAPSTSPTHTEQKSDSTPRSPCFLPRSVEDSASLINIIHHAKKPSTRKAYTVVLRKTKPLDVDVFVIAKAITKRCSLWGNSAFR